MPKSPKVLFFSVVDFGLRNGGVLCTANLLENMVRHASVKLTLITAARTSAESANREVAKQLGVRHIFIPLREIQAPTGALKVINALLGKYYHLFEIYCPPQAHVDQELSRLVKEISPDVVVVDGIWSAVRISMDGSASYCFVTHNRETEIYEDFVRYSYAPAATKTSIRDRLIQTVGRHGNVISSYRFERYVRRLYEQCTGVIALSHYDLPREIPAHVKRIVLPPLLPEREERWRYQGNRAMLFVGNVEYFANRVAVEWLRDRLAPELWELDCRARIDVIGAGGEFATGKKYSNINFLGTASQDEVVHRMTTDDLLVSPTTQRYGAKLKLAESAAHRMPFVATDSAMGGLPFLEFVPRINLEQPAAAAKLLLHYMDNPKLLTELSRRIEEGVAQARREQALAWAPFVRSLIQSKRSGSEGIEIVESRLI